MELSISDFNPENKENSELDFQTSSLKLPSISEQPVKVLPVYKSEELDLSMVKDMTLEQIAQRNFQLKQELEYNTGLLNLKKYEMKKSIREFENVIQLPRKVFAFRITFKDGTFSKIAVNNKIHECLDQIAVVNHTKITKLFTLNNFVYVKMAKDIIMNKMIYPGPDGCILEQVNPRSLIKMQ